MTKTLTAMFARAARPLALASLAVLAACTTLEPGSGAAGARVAARTEPAAQRVQGDLAELRRCMDNLLLEHGARDISVIVEDLADPGRRTTAISREMLAAAVSGMTQRSRAIRLVTSASVQPQYALRGSVGALDGAKPGTSAFGLDLTLLTTQDMSVVPGTATRNKVTLYGAGAEGRAEVGKFGVSFVVPAGGSDASSQALRALAEVSSVELFGRLARVPYWSCFGTTADDAAIAAEVQDWYDTMAARPAEIVGYFQAQLRTRRVYDGPIDGAVTPPFKEAVARPGWTCDGRACRAEIKGKTVGYFTEGEGAVPSCAGLDIVIAAYPLRGTCKSVAMHIDRFDVWRMGSHAVAIDGSILAIATARGRSGNRPWVVVPEPRRKVALAR